MIKITDILSSGADKSGVSAAVGTGSVSASAVAAITGKTDDAAQIKKAKKAKATKAAPKAEKADKMSDAGADDLKALSGVGPALEKKLHEAGITSFAQIAAWTEADIAEVDEKLSFKGRIQREGWVDQAKEKTKG